jgi:hypothetical protein
VVVFNELINRDDAMLIPFDFLIDVESLKLCKDLDHCLLHASLNHKGTVVWGCETLLSDLYTIYWFHSVTDLVILLCHKLTSLGCIFVV